MELVLAKLLKLPLLTVMSSTTKLLVASLLVKVKAIDASFEIDPVDIAEEVMAIVGPLVSNVQVNWVAATLLLPGASVNLPAATSIVHWPSAEGVNVAV